MCCAWQCRGGAESVLPGGVVQPFILCHTIAINDHTALWLCLHFSYWCACSVSCRLRVKRYFLFETLLPRTVQHVSIGLRKLVWLLA